MLSSPHNLNSAPDMTEKRFGIRASLPKSDPFTRLLDEQWETFHWFEREDERDSALTDMRKRHEFSRIGDSPTVLYEPISR